MKSFNVVTKNTKVAGAIAPINGCISNKRNKNIKVNKNINNVKTEKCGVYSSIEAVQEHLRRKSIGNISFHFEGNSVEATSTYLLDSLHHLTNTIEQRDSTSSNVIENKHHNALRNTYLS